MRDKIVEKTIEKTIEKTLNLENPNSDAQTKQKRLPVASRFYFRSNNFSISQQRIPDLQSQYFSLFYLVAQLRKYWYLVL